MACEVIVGPARSGKTTLLLRRYRETLRQFGPEWPLWLAPTLRGVEAVRHRLLDERFRACFRPSLMTFSQFARQILHHSPQPVRPLDAQMKRHLLRRIIQAHLDSGLLRHFGAIARTSGFLDLLSGWISDVKRREIWPEDFSRACEARGLTQRDIELSGLYEDYQDHLTRHGLFDAEGCFWSARTMLQEDGDRLLAGLSLVVVDGFTDFTRTQHEILEVLARHAGQLCVSLPLEPEPCRRELFHKSRQTLDELRQRLPQLTVAEVPRAASPAWPAMDHLERGLFDDPRRARPAPQTAGLEILATARQAGQIEHVGQRIKRLLVEGDNGAPVRPNDVVLVFRQPQEVAATLREVFTRLGIPYTLEAGHSLAAAPLLRRLVALLRLDADDWPWRPLSALLSSVDFRPRWPEWDGGRALAAIDHTLREARVPRGRNELLRALQRQEQRQAADLTATAAGEPARARKLQRLQQTRQTLAVVERLGQAFDALPRKATPSDWVEAWRRLAGALGMLDELDAPAVPQPAGNPPLVVPAALAWDRMADALAAADRLARCLGQTPVEIDRGAAIGLLTDVLQSVAVDTDRDEPGRVRVLSARSVRALAFPYVFLAGLSETSFPAPGREDRFYGDADSQRLIAAGLPLPTREERAGEEMLLFYEVLTRATRRLWLCYPAMDDAGQPLLPSPYLQEVEIACGQGAIERVERMDLSPLPAADELLDVASFRRRAVADVLSGNAAALAGLVRRAPDAPATVNLLAGMATVEQRAQREQFGSMEGLFRHQAALNALHAHFTPDRVYSVSQLEDYAACPFSFFLTHVLGVEPLEELELRPDYLARGQRAHQILALLHRRLNEAHGKPVSPAEIDEVEYERLWRSLLEETARGVSASALSAALDEIDGRVLAQWLTDYRRQHAEYDALAKDHDPQMRPAHFEVSFGGAPDVDSPLSTDRPLELRHGERVVRVSGRIDRIDLGACGGQTVHSVIDYKTGGAVSFSLDAALAGLALQLPLYALAVGELLITDRPSLAWRAGYWYLADGGFKPRRALACHEQEGGRLVPSATWTALRDALAATVVRLVDGMLRGEFPVYNADPECTSTCPLRTVCRINQVRALEKTWPPPTAAN